MGDNIYNQDPISVKRKGINSEIQFANNGGDDLESHPNVYVTFDGGVNATYFTGDGGHLSNISGGGTVGPGTVNHIAYFNSEDTISSADFLTINTSPNELLIDGDLTINGNIHSVDHVTTDDAVIFLANNNTSDLIASGIMLNRPGANVFYGVSGGSKNNFAIGLTNDSDKTSSITMLDSTDFQANIYGSLEIKGNNQLLFTDNVRVLSNGDKISIGKNVSTSGGQRSIYIGEQTGQNSSTNDTIGIGYYAGRTLQGLNSIAIGREAASDNQGDYAIAIGDSAGLAGQNNNSIAIGKDAGEFYQEPHSIAIGQNAGSNVQGINSVSIGQNAGKEHQEFKSIAIGLNASEYNQGSESVSIGVNSNASATNTISIGNNSKALGQYATTVGSGANATGNYSSTIGYAAQASGSSATASGTSATASGTSATALGQSATASGTSATALGTSSSVSGNYSSAIGYNAQASGNRSFATGLGAQATNDDTFAAGQSAIASSVNAIAIGNSSNAAGNYSVALGSVIKASGISSIAMGNSTNAEGEVSISIGSSANSTGNYSIAMGSNSKAIAQNAIAIGSQSNASTLNTIVLNASKKKLTSSNSNATYINPIRNVTINSNVLSYDRTSKEIVDTGLISISGSNVVISNLNTDLTLQQVSDVGNTTTNTVEFQNSHTAFTTDLVSNVGVKLDQLSNVVIQTPVDEQILIYNGGDWVNGFNQHSYIRIRNETGTTIVKGDCVYIIDANNVNIANVGLARADSQLTMPCIGIALENITTNNNGFAVTYGKASGVNTDGFLEGEKVYVSNVTTGGVSNVAPYGTSNPDLIQNVGVVMNSAVNGTIFVTGVGRANDIPNAEILPDETSVNYVYVNTSNNDLKKIDPQFLTTNVYTLQQVTAAGNTTSNTVEFQNSQTAFIITETNSTIDFSSNIIVNSGGNQIAIGNQAGQTTQQKNTVAIGNQAGNDDQQEAGVAIGNQAGKEEQRATCIAIGQSAGNKTQQKGSIAIGENAGKNDQQQNSVAIGRDAGHQTQGQNSIAIGYRAGYNQHDYTIVLNADSAGALNTNATYGFYVKPIRSNVNSNILQYNETTGEITSNNTINISGDITANAFFGTVTETSNLEQVVNRGNTTSNTVYFQNDTLSFKADSSIEVGTANLFVDTTTGRVGIGTDDPQRQLHLKVDSGSSSKILIENTDISSLTSGSSAISFRNTSSGVNTSSFNEVGFIGMNTVTNDHDTFTNEMNLRNMVNGTLTNTLRLNRDGDAIIEYGNVGIGTTTPSEKLEVDGETLVTGNVTALDFITTSDDRLKTRVGRLDNSLEKVNSLSGFIYKYNEISGYNTESSHVGLSAQDVQKILPEAIGSSGDYMALKYERVIPLLVEAIKELTQEVKNIKEKLM